MCASLAICGFQTSQPLSTDCLKYHIYVCGRILIPALGLAILGMRPVLAAPWACRSQYYWNAGGIASYINSGIPIYIWDAIRMLITDALTTLICML